MSRAISALALVLLAVTSLASAAEPETSVVAFVGKLVSLKEIPYQCPDPDTLKKSPEGDDTLCIKFHEYFEARYEVVEVFSGEVHAQEVTFFIADHYGFPRFADYQHALLFVELGPTENWLEKYQGYAVHRTSTNAWASCGNPYDERFGNSPRGLKPVSFAKDFGMVGEFSREGIARRFVGSKELVVEGDRIVCRNGVYAADLYDTVRTEVLAARGIHLPPLPAYRDES